MGRRRYSDEERAHALIALDANGGNVAKTARELGIPRVTLAEWAGGRVSDEVTEFRQGKRTVIIGKLDELTVKILDACPAKIEGASLQQAMTAAAIAIDKGCLLRGEPTEITDSTHDVHARHEFYVATDPTKMAEVVRVLEECGAGADPPAGPGAADQVDEVHPP